MVRRPHLRITLNAWNSAARASASGPDALGSKVAGRRVQGSGICDLPCPRDVLQTKLAVVNLRIQLPSVVCEVFCSFIVFILLEPVQHVCKCSAYVQSSGMGLHSGFLHGSEISHLSLKEFVQSNEAVRAERADSAMCADRSGGVSSENQTLKCSLNQNV